MVFLQFCFFQVIIHIIYKRECIQIAIVIFFSLVELFFSTSTL